MKVVYSPAHRGHDPKTGIELSTIIPAFEHIGRAEAIRETLQSDSRFDLVLPPELTFHRPGDRRTLAEFHADVRAWLRAHGVDPADQAATMQVQRESRRAHAVTVRDLPSLDQARRRAEGAGPDDAA